MERDPKERIAELLKANNEYLDGWRRKAKTAVSRCSRAALNDNVRHAITPAWRETTCGSTRPVGRRVAGRQLG